MDMDAISQTIAILAIGGGVAGIIWAWKGKAAFVGVAYTGGKDLLTPPEKAFFQFLVKAVGSRAHVCPKVRIADILDVANGFHSKEDQDKAFRMIAQKHVDFAVMDAHGQVRFAVEVDDSSHDRPDRRERDVFVNDAFGSSGVPLVRVKPRGFKGNKALLKQLEDLGVPS